MTRKIDFELIDILKQECKRENVTMSNKELMMVHDAITEAYNKVTGKDPFAVSQ